MKKLSIFLLIICSSDVYAGGSIKLSGIDSYINLGNGLGLSEFTLEAWIKIEGSGITTSSGNGGVTAVPIICKGRGEEDANNKDCNYFFGYNPTTMKLAADFEEGAIGTSPGLNHPINGTINLIQNRWYHVAVTYDGRKWYLYVDGILDSSKFINQPVQNQSIQYASIGTALTSTASPAGYFNGSIDEVRIWKRARTVEEIRYNINMEIIGNEDGLAGYWKLNEGSGYLVRGATSNPINGNLYNNNFIWSASNAPFNISLTPTKKTAPLLFKAGIVADPQYADAPSNDRYYRESLNKLAIALDTFNVQNVSFVQTLGDLIDRDSLSFNPILNVYKKLKLTIPNYHLLGNHDFNIQQAFKTKVVQKLGMPSNYYSYTYNGFRFIVLDATDLAAYTDDLNPTNIGRDKLERDSLFLQSEVTNTTDYNGAIGRVQMVWLKSELDLSVSKNENVIVFCHMPVLPAQEVDNLWNDYEIISTLSKYKNVRAYLNGHRHAGGYNFLNSIHFVTVYGMVQGTGNSYAVMNVYEDKIVLKGYGNQEDLILNFKNIAPEDIIITNDKISNQNKKGDLVGVLKAIDENKYDGHFYSFVPGDGDTDNQLFRISNDSLYLNTNQDLSLKTNYSIRIKAIDSENTTISKTLILNYQNNSNTSSLNQLEFLKPAESVDIKVFPNPTNNKLNVHVTNIDSYRYAIIDTYGHELRTDNQTEIRNNKINTIDLNEFNKGIYFFMLKTENKIIAKRFIIK